MVGIDRERGSDRERYVNVHAVLHWEFHKPKPAISFIHSHNLYTPSVHCTCTVNVYT